MNGQTDSKVDRRRTVVLGPGDRSSPKRGNASSVPAWYEDMPVYFDFAIRRVNSGQCHDFVNIENYKENEGFGAMHHSLPAECGRLP
jgi:hypothetical protein